MGKTTLMMYSSSNTKMKYSSSNTKMNLLSAVTIAAQLWSNFFNLIVLYLPLLKDLSFPGSHIPPVCIQHCITQSATMGDIYCVQCIFDCLPVSVTTQPVYSGYHYAQCFILSACFATVKIIRTPAILSLLTFDG